MEWRRRGWTLAAAALVSALGGVVTLRAQSPEAPPSKSVYGNLDSVVAGQRAVVMRSETGERLVWRFRPEVVEAVSEFAPGDEMIVIYRQTAPNQKVVTAVAFPGTATAPTYINLTGAKVLLRSGPKVGGVCAASPEVTETPIIEGGQAETGAECWCCAAEGESCEPSNETGLGRGFLVRCFE